MRPLVVDLAEPAASRIIHGLPGQGVELPLGRATPDVLVEDEPGVVQVVSEANQRAPDDVAANN